MWDHLQTNLPVYIQTLTILLTGIAAYVVYYVQKRSEIRSAALALVLEIQNAENRLNIILTQGVDINRHDKLSSEIWLTKRDLFAKSLSHHQYQVLETYFQCIRKIDESIERIRDHDHAGFLERSRQAQRFLSDLSARLSRKKRMTPEKRARVYDKRKNAYLAMLHAEAYWYLPNAPKSVLVSYAQSVQPIMNSPLGAKLKKMAKYT